MKAAVVFQRTIPYLMAAAAVTLAGCATMESAWDSTKSATASAWDSTTGLFSGSSVKLSGGEEVPPVTTSASGSGTITIKDDRSVSGSVSTSGIAGIAAHIHVGAAGKNGPVIVPLTKGADGTTWSVPAGAKLTEAQYDAYKAGDLYVNVHSAAHKGGEIRGQLKP
jgi:ABC-type Fe3+-hydroxamate transport system substrate-binding protein